MMTAKDGGYSVDFTIGVNTVDVGFIPKNRVSEYVDVLLEHVKEVEDFTGYGVEDHVVGWGLTPNLEAEVGTLEDSRAGLLEDLHDANRQLAEMEGRISELEEEVDDLIVINGDLNVEIADLMKEPF